MTQFRISSTLTLASALLLSACGDADPPPPPITVWPVSEQVTMARLAQADVQGLALTMRCDAQISITPATPSAHVISWNISRGFNQLGRFSVRLSAITPTNTHTDIDIPPDPQGGEMFDAARPMPDPVFNGPLRPALDELVRAAMEQRPFDQRLLPPGIANGGVCGHGAPAPNPGAAPPPQPAMPDASPPQPDQAAPTPAPQAAAQGDDDETPRRAGGGTVVE